MAHAPSQSPTWVYKILDTAKNDPRYLFPTPIPASHTFFLPALDYKDGYVHLSTANQLPNTLNRFFADHDEVVLLRLDYKRLSAFKDVRWEPTSSGEAFPHLYGGGGIEGENVDSFKEVKRNTSLSEKTTAWNDPLEQLRSEGWLVY